MTASRWYSVLTWTPSAGAVADGRWPFSRYAVRVAVSGHAPPPLLGQQRAQLAAQLEGQLPRAGVAQQDAEHPEVVRPRDAGAPPERGEGPRRPGRVQVGVPEASAAR